MGILVGARGAIFSSLLGVWQTIPYLFADFWGRLRNGTGMDGASSIRASLPCQLYLFVLATVPAAGTSVAGHTLVSEQGVCALSPSCAAAAHISATLFRPTWEIRGKSSP